MPQQLHIFYSGIVQGVGFRYTTEHLARSLGLKGWVRNLADRRVELVVQGPEQTVEEFTRRLEARFDGSIRDKDVSSEKPTPAFTDFRIVASA